jgi:hypothetical protein
MNETILSNEELFAKADFEARQTEMRIGRQLSSDEYSEFVYWYMKSLRYTPELRPPNPFE